MHKQIAAEWTEALRSGEYAQGTAYLLKGSQDKGLFCCLGVLCDLHRQRVGGDWTPGPAGNQAYRPLGADDWDNSLLPVSVRDWAGLRSVNPEAVGVTLTARNDEGWTFDRLAEFIDTNAKDL